MAHDTPGASSDSVRRRGLVRAPQDLLGGSSLVALALFALWASKDLGVGRLRAVGPGMLPRVIAMLVGLAGVALVAASLVKEGDPLGRWSVRAPLFVCLGAVGFALTIRSPGLVVAGPLVALVSGAASRETRFKELVVFAIAITAFCIALFRYALHLPIPILVIPGLVTI